MNFVENKKSLQAKYDYLALQKKKLLETNAELTAQIEQNMKTVNNYEQQQQDLTKRMAVAR